MAGSEEAEFLNDSSRLHIVNISKRGWHNGKGKYCNIVLIV